jgi:hypothetical protein
MEENEHFFNTRKSTDLRDLSKVDIFSNEDFETTFQNGPPPFKEKKQQRKEPSKEKSNEKLPKSVRSEFTAEEDENIRKFVQKNGACNWKKLAEEMPGRNRRSLRLRYVSTLSKNNDAPFTDHDEELLIESVKKYGKKWSKIRNHVFRDRSDTFLKNRFNSTQRKLSKAPQSVPTIAFKQFFNDKSFFDMLTDLDDSIFCENFLCQ